MVFSVQTHKHTHAKMSKLLQVFFTGTGADFGEKVQGSGHSSQVPSCDPIFLSDLGVMSLLDHEDGCSRGGGSDCDPLAPASGLQRPPAFPYQYPVPHPYSSPDPLHQLPAWGGGRGGGSQHSEGDASVFSLLFYADKNQLYSCLLNTNIQYPSVVP